MDGTGKHYTKWNKSGSERQILYDLTYKWNLINITKISKKTWRHGNKEHTNSDQSGGRRGITG